MNKYGVQPRCKVCYMTDLALIQDEGVIKCLYCGTRFDDMTLYFDQETGKITDYVLVRERKKVEGAK